MTSQKKTVAVFGSYRPKPAEAEYERARELGGMIAFRGWVLINGGYGGTMEASARGARERGGHVVGVTVKTRSREANEFTDETRCTENLWERLQVLIERSDAYIILPGATGTLAEIGLAWEFICKNLVQPKPLVFVGEFWAPLYRLMVPNPESKTACGGLVHMASTPEEAVDFIASVLEE